VKSFLSYLGGKSLLTRKIIPLIPQHECYCEVFAGAAWLLFRKEESQVEIINDINVDLVTLYRVIKHHLEEFIRYFKWILVARDEFERFKLEDPQTLTDIQRAVRFYYLLKGGYGSKLVGQSFNVGPTRPPRLNLLRIEEDLSAAHLRLSRVYIENMAYGRLIERFDRPETFFYVDPPYYGYEDYYGKEVFSRADFAVLASLLASITGKFILSINDTPEIRKIYRGFQFAEATTSYSAAGADKKKHVTELLITNF
jgi:DNA adenine methylase